MIDGKRIVAVCTSRIYDPQTHYFLETLGRKINGQGDRLFIYTINSDFYWNEDTFFADAYLFEQIPYDQIDAIVIMDEKIKSKRVTNEIVRRSADNSVPVLVIDGEHENTASIHFDYKKGFENMVRHVIEYHKVHHPHFMAGFQGDAFSEERLEIFRKVIRENGIEFTDDMLSYGDFWAKPARREALKLINRGSLPEAVICANDIMAINVCDVFREAGIDVPSQVIVTGFDGIDESFFSTPSLSTVNCDYGELAEKVLEMTNAFLEHERIEDGSVVPKLILRDSCGCCSEKDGLPLTSRFNHGFYRYQDDVSELYEISANMQLADSTMELGRLLRKNITHGELVNNMCCIVKQACFIREKNYFLEDTPEDKLCVVYNSFCPDAGLVNISRSEICPDLKKILDRGCTLIFNALSYMNKPIGYICYYFDGYDITDYSRISSTTKSVNMGLGGYINMKYQQYLLERVEDMYRRDSLTGLYNRTGFSNAFDKIRKESQNTARKVSVMMADLDGLKYINDTFGHSEGDKAIAVVAHALKEACPEDSLCVRFGGDEMFAVYLGDVDSEKIIWDIQTILNRYNETSKDAYKVSASCGVCTEILDERFELKEAIKKADEQMYKNKRKSVREV